MHYFTDSEPSKMDSVVKLEQQEMMSNVIIFLAMFYRQLQTVWSSWILA